MTIACVAALRAAGCRMALPDVAPLVVEAQPRAPHVVPVPAAEPSGATRVAGLAPVFVQSVLLPVAVTIAADWYCRAMTCLTPPAAVQALRADSPDDYDSLA